MPPKRSLKVVKDDKVIAALVGKRVRITQGNDKGCFAIVDGPTPYYPDGETILVWLEGNNLPRNVNVGNVKLAPKRKTGSLKQKARKKKAGAGT